MPALGQTVLYRLDHLDVRGIERTRAQAHAAAAAATVPAPVDGGADIEVGDTLPAIVTRVHNLDPDAGVNLRIVLDGTDDLWVEGRTEGTGPGTWCWPDM